MHTDPWRVLRIQSEFIDGFGTLAELGPAVSVFGSARTSRDHPLYATAERLGAQLLRAGLAVPTGGGPGIMEATNKVAAEAGGVSVGERSRPPIWTPSPSPMMPTKRSI